MQNTFNSDQIHEIDEIANETLVVTEDEITNTLQLPIDDLKILGFKVEDEDAKYFDQKQQVSSPERSQESPLKRLHVNHQLSVAQQVDRMSL